MSYFAPFSPIGSNVSVTTLAGASTGATALPSDAAGNVIMVYNSGASPAFMKLGGAGVAAAAASDIPIPPNSMMPFSIDPATQTHFTIFSATAGMVVYVMRGGGT